MDNTPHTTLDAAIDKLNSFCRGEMSAVETYSEAISSGVLSRFSERLRQCRNSHETRVDLLRAQIGMLGGQPPASSGAWGTFAKVAENTAAAAGERAALTVLEEGEDHGLNVYRTQTSDLDIASNVLVNQRLLPLQLETHRIVNDLKSQLD